MSELSDAFYEAYAQGVIDVLRRQGVSASGMRDSGEHWLVELQVPNHIIKKVLQDV